MASGRYSLLYRYSTDGMNTWKDFTDIVDSSQTKVVQQLCSTQCKSIVDKASVVIPAQDSPLKRDLIKAILEGYGIYVQIFDLKPSPMLWDDEAMMWKDRAMMWSSSLPVFTGVIDRKESTTIKSFPFTPSVSLSLKDLSSLRLDEKVGSYVYLEDKPEDRLTITKAVRYLLSLAGYEWTSDAIEESEERTLPCFVVDKDNAKTYREYIDTLLFEACGYVLDFDRYGRARIVRLPWDDRDSSHARTIDNPLVADGVSTKVDSFENDGTKLTWATLAESSPDQLVYQDSIQRSVDKDTGLLLGVDVPNGGYWPEDGDVQATYQQFSADFLDKPYLIKDSRKRNEDLSIIAVRDVYAYIQATFPNGAKFDSWEYPVLPSLGMESNPTIWPTKAWYLLRNNSGEKVNLQMFTLRGRVMYRAKVNEETVPLSSKKPKEYTSTYIYTQAHAKRFAQFWWHYLNTTRYVTTYTEMDRGSLGETVRINHKGVEYGQDSMVISIETKWLNHGTKRVTSTAIGVSAYNEYPSLSTSMVPGRKENGNGISKVEYRYAVTQTQEAPAPVDVTLSDIPTMSETDKYLWRKETITFTDPSFPDSVSVVLVSVYGDKGEQGNPGTPAKVFSLTCDRTSVIRNDRLAGAVVYKFTIVVQGYENANPQLTVNGENMTDEMEFDEDTGAFFYLFIMEKRGARPITAILYDGTKEMDRIELQVVDSTLQESYIGVRDEAPSRFDETQSLLKGDWYVLKSTNVLYIWNGTSWEEKTVDSPGDFSYLSKVSIAMTDMIKIGTTDKTTATILGVFKYLAADQGFIKFLSVYNLLIDNPDGMSVDIRSRDEFGVPLATPVFDVKFKAKSVFRIDPANGNVYMGSGFFYQASDESIRSSSGKVVIDSNGQLQASDAVIEDAFFSGNFDCKVIKTQNLPSISDPFVISTISSKQAQTFVSQIQGSSVSSYRNNVFYECSVSLVSSARYVQFSDGLVGHGHNTHIIGLSFVLKTHGYVTFYDKNYRELDISSYVSGKREARMDAKPEYDFGKSISNGSIATCVITRNYKGNIYEEEFGIYFSQECTITIYTGGQMLKLDIPESSTNLSSGMVYSDGGTLKIVP